MELGVSDKLSISTNVLELTLSNTRVDYETNTYKDHCTSLMGVTWNAFCLKAATKRC